MINEAQLEQIEKRFNSLKSQIDEIERHNARVEEKIKTLKSEQDSIESQIKSNGYESVQDADTKIAKQCQAIQTEIMQREPEIEKIHSQIQNDK